MSIASDMIELFKTNPNDEINVLEVSKTLGIDIRDTSSNLSALARRNHIEVVGKVFIKGYRSKFTV